MSRQSDRSSEMGQGDILARLASMEISTTEAEMTGFIQELGGWIKDASREELRAFVREMTAFAQRIGGLPLDDQAALAGDPVERLRAAALGYYGSALLKVYQLQRLQQDEPQV